MLASVPCSGICFHTMRGHKLLHAKVPDMIGRIGIFEPTCANAQWALRSRFLSVCLSVCPSVCLSVTRQKLLDKRSGGQRSQWSRSNVTWVEVKGHIGKQRQVGSHQRQVASLFIIFFFSQSG